MSLIRERWKLPPRFKASGFSPYQEPITTRPLKAVDSMAWFKAAGAPESSRVRSAPDFKQAAAWARKSGANGSSAALTPRASEAARRRGKASTVTRLSSGNSARRAVVNRPISPWPKTSTRSPKSGAASCTRLTAVSVLGKKVAISGETPAGRVNNIDAGTIKCEACGWKANTSRPNQAASTWLPISVTRPTQA